MSIKRKTLCASLCVTVCVCGCVCEKPCVYMTVCVIACGGGMCVYVTVGVNVHVQALQVCALYVGVNAADMCLCACL